MGAIARLGSPSAPRTTAPSTAPTAAPSSAPPHIYGVPRGWCGIPHGQPFTVSFRFPCIGTACAAHRAWHEPGVTAQGFRDFSSVFFNTDAEWQHMCQRCASCESEVQLGGGPRVRTRAARRRGEVEVSGPGADCRARLAASVSGLLVGPWHASLSDRAVGRTGPGTGLLRVAALVGVFEL